MVLKKLDILEQLASEPKFPDTQSVVSPAPPVEWMVSPPESGKLREKADPKT